MMDKLNEDEMIFKNFLPINKTNRHFSTTTQTPTITTSAYVEGLQWYGSNGTIDESNAIDLYESHHFEDPGYFLRYSITVTALLR